MIPNHCRDCGVHFPETQQEKGYDTDDGSITCDACGHKVWDNPIPVAVWVQPVEHDFGDGKTRTGLAIARRAIEPRLGTWCLFGGHIGNGETAEEAGRREWNEETGLDAHNVEDLRLFGTYANGKGHLLIAMLAPPITLYEFTHATLCPENDAIDVLWFEEKCADLGFPIHQQIAYKWFMEEKFAEPTVTIEMEEYARQLLSEPGRPA